MIIPQLRFDFLKQDISAGFVVFLVALPLCLGIAVASEAPPISGLITGIIAGILVSLLSGSELSVSGPAAGLAVTVIAATREIGAFEGLLVATALSGMFQIILGGLRAGHLATFFPSAVIKGMLAGIGIIIAFKQIPHAVGWRSHFNPEDGMFCIFSPFCLRSLWSQIESATGSFDIAAIVISSVSLLVLLMWEKLPKKHFGSIASIPGPLVVVFVGILLNQVIQVAVPGMGLTAEEGQLITLPAISRFKDLFTLKPEELRMWLSHPAVWSSALTIAVIGSVETLLTIEATEKLDPLRRTSHPNRELVAQGVGNITAGILGGLPLTSVIVRSTTNVYSGARTRLAGMTQGLLLLLSVLLFPSLLNKIPLAALAAILIVVGYKLAHVKIIRGAWKSGLDQFLPFAVTAAGVVLFDLLTGVFVGTIFGFVVVVIMNHHSAITVVNDGNYYYVRFAKDVTFLQKIALKRALAQLPNNSDIVVDCGGAMFIDHDILELLEDFKESALDRHITVDITNLPTIRLKLHTAFSKRTAHG